MESALSNPDGFGMAYVKEGKVEISKGFFNIDQFLPVYQRIAEQYGRDNPMLIHFRIATEGAVTPDNTHPFRTKHGALIHNGCLWFSDGGKDAKKSDTRVLVDTLYNELDYDTIRAALPAVTEAFSGNKIGLLYNDGRVHRIGNWVEDEGIYYSNRTYVPWRAASKYAPPVLISDF